VVCSNSLFPTRKLLEDSFDEGEGKSYTYIVVYIKSLSSSGAGRSAAWSP
jgi:hypothetical protein